MDGLLKTFLDPAFALDCLQEQLALGDRLGEALLKKPLGWGQVWTWLPPGLVIDSKRHLDYDHEEVDYGLCRDELYRFIATFLQENDPEVAQATGRKPGLFLEEGVLIEHRGARVPEIRGRMFLNEPSLHQFWSSFDDPSPVHGIAVYPWLDATFLTPQDEEKTIRTIDKTFQGRRCYPTIGCLTVTDMPLPQEMTSFISHDGIQRLADSAQHIIVGAFDECGCVVWTDSSEQ